MEEICRDISELEKKTNGLRAEILNSYEGTAKYTAIKESLTQFETEIAPEKNLVPQDRQYQIERAAILIPYIRENLTENKGKGVEGILYAYGYSAEEIEGIKEAYRTIIISQANAHLKEEREAKIVHRGI